MPFPTAQQVSFLACSSHCPFNAELKQRSYEYQFFNDWLDPTRNQFQVSTAPKADALKLPLSDLSCCTTWLCGLPNGNSITSLDCVNDILLLLCADVLKM